MEMEMDSTVNLSVMASLEEVSSIAYDTNNYYYLRRVFRHSSPGTLRPLYDRVRKHEYLYRNKSQRQSGDALYD